MHNYQDLITLFNQCFLKTHQTQLVRGDDEPLYLPANEKEPLHSVIFAHGYFSSALHECAHWFIAGPQRRLQIDYGYWYVPDGRNAEEQKMFEQVEVKPQAIEWILSMTANYPFHFSIDNLSGTETDPKAFKNAVTKQVEYYTQHGLPARAELFRQKLALFYGSAASIF